MARQIGRRNAKRSDRPNPREDRNYPNKKTKNYSDNDESTTTRRQKITIVPRNLAQEEYIDALTDDEKYIVFAMGPAGCGKTMLATLYAIKGLQEGKFDRIVITRPAVSVDEQHGFLPGGLFEKMQPWVMPILDVFREYGYSPKDITSMIENGTLEIAPLAYMRGRTFKNAFIIFDEAQNSTPNQTKMVLTRIGEGSRMVVTGDLQQHDRGYDDNGLKDIVDRFHERNPKTMEVVEFEPSDVERHPVIEDVLKLYRD